MTFRIHLPSFPLSQFVESFVYFKEIEPLHDYERFLPDGNIHLVMDLTENSQFIYDNNTLQKIQECKKVWFSGIRTKCITIPSGRGSENFIVNSHRGRVFPFTHTPVNEYTDFVVDAELVLSPEILSIRNRLMELKTVQEKFIYAEQRLVQVYSSNFSHNPVIDFAVNRIMQAPQLTSIEDISGKTGYSQKHFIRLFKENVGITPKAFLRVMRFQKAVQEIEQQKQIHWTTVAHDCGYYDQAHFINDFKTFSGYTPEQYVQLKSKEINYVPVG